MLSGIGILFLGWFVILQNSVTFCVKLKYVMSNRYYRLVASRLIALFISSKLFNFLKRFCKFQLQKITKPTLNTLYKDFLCHITRCPKCISPRSPRCLHFNKFFISFPPEFPGEGSKLSPTFAPARVTRRKTLLPETSSFALCAKDATGERVPGLK